MRFSSVRAQVDHDSRSHEHIVQYGFLFSADSCGLCSVSVLQAVYSGGTPVRSDRRGRPWRGADVYSVSTVTDASVPLCPLVRSCVSVDRAASYCTVTLLRFYRQRSAELSADRLGCTCSLHSD